MKLHLAEVPTSTQEVVINRRLFDSDYKNMSLDFKSHEPQLLVLDNSDNDEDLLSVCSSNDSFDEELEIYTKPVEHKLARLRAIASQLQNDREAMQSSRELLAKEVQNIYSTIEALSSALLLRKREDLFTL